ncbi:MAG TPA: zf-HC2 domain-containing protein, partial [Anaerolineaceae bacterium]|nr:zf-HC2 domain-containing protein [Anaerolineaceae bacterium]
MNDQLSSKDWQLLSAYLDGQLSNRERAQVEQRLRIHPEYRDALQTLRQNQVMLRSLPRRRVPRNFTLTPEMVAAPRRTLIPPLAPFLRFSSALAT